MGIAKENAAQILSEFRKSAKENEIQDMAPKDINNEIRCVRYEKVPENIRNFFLIKIKECDIIIM